jgi:hypothetical protein
MKPAWVKKLLPEELKKLFISPSIFVRMQRWGWVTPSGVSLEWWQHQRYNHNDQFDEPRERKPRKKKFVKPSERRDRD